MAYRSSSNSHNDDLLSKLKNLDAFPKQREEAAEFFQSTVSGGVITIVAGFIMTLLFFSELGKPSCLRVHVASHRSHSITFLRPTRVLAALNGPNGHARTRRCG